eukprot:362018_1
MALIHLCSHFKWNKVGILHTANEYGNSLNKALTEFAEIHGIHTQSFSFIIHDPSTLTNPINAMKLSNIFMFILVASPMNIHSISNELQAHDMLKFPYFYIGNYGMLHSIAFNPQLSPGLVGTCA